MSRTQASKPSAARHGPIAGGDRAGDADSVRLTLPIPPSTNHAYANRRGGGRLLSRAGREYKQHASALARMQGARLHRGEVSVRATVYFADRRRDLDNAAKLLLDSLKGACFVDDIQVAHLELWRGLDRGNPRCEVAVELLSEFRARMPANPADPHLKCVVSPESKAAA